MFLQNGKFRWFVLITLSKQMDSFTQENMDLTQMEE